MLIRDERQAWKCQRSITIDYGKYYIMNPNAKET